MSNKTVFLSPNYNCPSSNNQTRKQWRHLYHYNSKRVQKKVHPVFNSNMIDFRFKLEFSQTQKYTHTQIQKKNTKKNLEDELFYTKRPDIWKMESEGWKGYSKIFFNKRANRLKICSNFSFIFRNFWFATNSIFFLFILFLSLLLMMHET